MFVLGLHLKCNVSAIPIFPTKVTVEITNRLSMKHLDVHCKDKHHDLGLITLNVNATYSFRFYPNYYLPRTLYFCRFEWLDSDYHFDIYVEKRDGYCIHNRYHCSWDILENGPCKITHGHPRCFTWNKVFTGKNNTFSL